MPDDNLPLAEFGGRLNLDVGVLFSSDDVDAIGDMAVKTVYHLLAVMLYDEATTRPQTGVAGDLRGVNPVSSERGHLEASKGSGDLDYDVEAGWGMVYDTGHTPTAFTLEAYRPVVLSAATSGSVAAHEAGARRDIIIAQPAYVEDNATTRNVRDPSDQSITTPSVNTRRRFSATISAVKGVSGSQSLPAVPTDAILLAVVDVPATSGAITVHDRRQFLRWSSLRSYLPGYMTHDHVVSDGAPATPFEATVSSFDVTIDVGEAVVDGNRVRTTTTASSTRTAASASNTRHDLVTISRTGAIAITTGTEATTGSQTDPTQPTDTLLLYRLVVTSSGITVTDLRNLKPFSGGQLADDSVDTAQIADGAVTATQIAYAAENRTFAVPGSAFAVEQNDGSLIEFNLNQGRLSPETGSTLYDLQAMLVLPQGATINGASVSIANTSGSSVSVTFAVQRVSMTADSFDTIATTASSVSTGGTTTLSLSGFTNAEVDNGSYAYIALVQFTSPASGFANVKLLGARIQVSTSQLLS